MTRLLAAIAAVTFSMMAAAPVLAACSGMPHDKSAETSEPVVIPEDVNA